MKRISLNFLYPLGALIILTVVLNMKVFMVPPLGTFLNPFIGIVQNENGTDLNKEINAGRTLGVEILFDDRAVPHIFAKNQKDLFFAQGYVCASDRLWQMDFLSYASAGRLSEVLGEEFLENDRAQRRNGMLKAAEMSLKFIEKDAETKLALDNYTAGVNAYIESLSYADLPLEYKLMDYRPEPWTNLKSVLVMKYMSALLSGYEEDVAASYARMTLGEEEYDMLYSNFCIQKSGNGFALERIADTLPEMDYIDYSFLKSIPEIAESQFNPRLGSNSWVIGPDKSKSGAAILCNDPHLSLSFPAIWYEVQLKSDVQNVYGYSIPGVPSVIIGFNENISWGLTNGSTDVRDYYKLLLKDDYSYYQYDGKWRETEMRIEEIKIRYGKPYYDTVYYSIHGPIYSDAQFGNPESVGCAINWSLHDPSNEFLTFIKLNKASNYQDFSKAVKYYKCPVQNFSYADVDGNIALHHQGKILEHKWKDRGKFILDGTKSSHFSKQTLKEPLPHEYNPSQGYVFSANNNPYGLQNGLMIYGHYSELRADKIESSLSAKGKFSLEDMKSLQLDNTNRLAELALPILLKRMKGYSHQYLNEFSRWDCEYTKDSKLAPVFESWWNNIRDKTWDELMRSEHLKKLPDDLVLLDLICNDPSNKYFDLLSTEKVETASDILRIAFKKTINNVDPGQKWETMNDVSLMHLTNIQALSRLLAPSGGHPNAINAMSYNWGPSLRMVVEMGKRPKAYGIYAGGQSGNPASVEYDRYIGDWAEGRYYELHFFVNEREAKSKTQYKWSIK